MSYIIVTDEKPRAVDSRPVFPQPLQAPVKEHAPHEDVLFNEEAVQRRVEEATQALQATFYHSPKKETWEPTLLFHDFSKSGQLIKPIVQHDHNRLQFSYHSRLFKSPEEGGLVSPGLAERMQNQEYITDDVGVPIQRAMQPGTTSGTKGLLAGIASGEKSGPQGFGLQTTGTSGVTYQPIAAIYQPTGATYEPSNLPFHGVERTERVFVGSTFLGLQQGELGRPQLSNPQQVGRQQIGQDFERPTQDFAKPQLMRVPGEWSSAEDMSLKFYELEPKSRVGSNYQTDFSAEEGHQKLNGVSMLAGTIAMSNALLLDGIPSHAHTHPLHQSGSGLLHQQQDGGALLQQHGSTAMQQQDDANLLQNRILFLPPTPALEITPRASPIGVPMGHFQQGGVGDTVSEQDSRFALPGAPTLQLTSQFAPPHLSHVPTTQTQRFGLFPQTLWNTFAKAAVEPGSEEPRSSEMNDNTTVTASTMEGGTAQASSNSGAAFDTTNQLGTTNQSGTSNQATRTTDQSGMGTALGAARKSLAAMGTDAFQFMASIVRNSPASAAHGSADVTIKDYKLGEANASFAEARQGAFSMPKPLLSASVFQTGANQDENQRNAEFAIQINASEEYSGDAFTPAQKPIRMKRASQQRPVAPASPTRSSSPVLGSRSQSSRKAFEGQPVVESMAQSESLAQPIATKYQPTFQSKQYCQSNINSHGKQTKVLSKEGNLDQGMTLVQSKGTIRSKGSSATCNPHSGATSDHKSQSRYESEEAALNDEREKRTRRFDKIDPIAHHYQPTPFKSTLRFDGSSIRSDSGVRSRRSDTPNSGGNSPTTFNAALNAANAIPNSDIHHLASTLTTIESMVDQGRKSSLGSRSQGSSRTRSAGSRFPVGSPQLGIRKPDTAPQSTRRSRQSNSRSPQTGSRSPPKIGKPNPQTGLCATSSQTRRPISYGTSNVLEQEEEAFNEFLRNIDNEVKNYAMRAQSTASKRASPSVGRFQTGHLQPVTDFVSPLIPGIQGMGMSINISQPSCRTGSPTLVECLPKASFSRATPSSQGIKRFLNDGATVNRFQRGSTVRGTSTFVNRIDNPSGLQKESTAMNRIGNDSTSVGAMVTGLTDGSVSQSPAGCLQTGAFQKTLRKPFKPVQHPSLHKKSEYHTGWEGLYLDHEKGTGIHIDIAAASDMSTWEQVDYLGQKRWLRTSNPSENTVGLDKKNRTQSATPTITMPSETPIMFSGLKKVKNISKSNAMPSMSEEEKPVTAAVPSMLVREPKKEENVSPNTNGPFMNGTSNGPYDAKKRSKKTEMAKATSDGSQPTASKDAIGQRIDAIENMVQDLNKTVTALRDESAERARKTGWDRFHEDLKIEAGLTVSPNRGSLARKSERQHVPQPEEHSAFNMPTPDAFLHLDLFNKQENGRGPKNCSNSTTKGSDPLSLNQRNANPGKQHKLYYGNPAGEHRTSDGVDADGCDYGVDVDGVVTHVDPITGTKLSISLDSVIAGVTPRLPGGSSPHKVDAAGLPVEISKERRSVRHGSHGSHLKKQQIKEEQTWVKQDINSELHVGRTSILDAMTLSFDEMDATLNTLVRDASHQEYEMKHPSSKIREYPSSKIHEHPFLPASGYLYSSSKERQYTPSKERVKRVANENSARESAKAIKPSVKASKTFEMQVKDVDYFDRSIAEAKANLGSLGSGASAQSDPKTLVPRSEFCRLPINAKTLKDYERILEAWVVEKQFEDTSIDEARMLVMGGYANIRTGSNNLSGKRRSGSQAEKCNALGIPGNSTSGAVNATGTAGNSTSDAAATLASASVAGSNAPIESIFHGITPSITGQACQEGISRLIETGPGMDYLKQLVQDSKQGRSRTQSPSVKNDIKPIPKKLPFLKKNSDGISKKNPDGCLPGSNISPTDATLMETPPTDAHPHRETLLCEKIAENNKLMMEAFNTLSASQREILGTLKTEQHARVTYQHAGADCEKRLMIINARKNSKVDAGNDQIDPTGQNRSENDEKRENDERRLMTIQENREQIDRAWGDAVYVLGSARSGGSAASGKAAANASASATSAHGISNSQPGAIDTTRIKAKAKRILCTGTARKSMLKYQPRMEELGTVRFESQSLSPRSATLGQATSRRATRSKASASRSVSPGVTSVSPAAPGTENSRSVSPGNVDARSVSPSNANSGRSVAFHTATPQSASMQSPSTQSPPSPSIPVVAHVTPKIVRDSPRARTSPNSPGMNSNMPKLNPNSTKAEVGKLFASPNSQSRPVGKALSPRSGSPRARDEFLKAGKALTGMDPYNYFETTQAVKSVAEKSGSLRGEMSVAPRGKKNVTPRGNKSRSPDQQRVMEKLPLTKKILSRPAKASDASFYSSAPMSVSRTGNRSLSPEGQRTSDSPEGQIQGVQKKEVKKAQQQSQAEAPFPFTPQRALTGHMRKRSLLSDDITVRTTQSHQFVNKTHCNVCAAAARQNPSLATIDYKKGGLKNAVAGGGGQDTEGGGQDTDTEILREADFRTVLKQRQEALDMEEKNIIRNRMLAKKGAEKKTSDNLTENYDHQVAQAIIDRQRKIRK